jgi:hypothetical protein
MNGNQIILLGKRFEDYDEIVKHLAVVEPYFVEFGYGNNYCSCLPDLYMTCFVVGDTFSAFIQSLAQRYKSRRQLIEKICRLPSVQQIFLRNSKDWLASLKLKQSLTHCTPKPKPEVIDIQD